MASGLSLTLVALMVVTVSHASGINFPVEGVARLQEANIHFLQNAKEARDVCGLSEEKQVEARLLNLEIKPVDDCCSQPGISISIDRCTAVLPATAKNPTIQVDLISNGQLTGHGDAAYLNLRKRKSGLTSYFSGTYAPFTLKHANLQTTDPVDERINTEITCQIHCCFDNDAPANAIGERCPVDYGQQIGPYTKPY